jgi:hypothetical protein
MIKRMNLTIYTDKGVIHYLNISRTAVKYYIAYHQENPDFYGYALD